MRIATKFFTAIFVLGIAVLLLFGVLNVQNEKNEITPSSQVRVDPEKTLLDKPVLLTSSFEYSGNNYNIQEVMSGYDQDTMQLEGDLVRKDANSNYVVVITLSDPDNYAWSDGEPGATRYLGWQITPIVVTQPTLSGSNNFTYNKAMQSIQFSEPIDTTIMTLSGDTTKINAGDYTATVSLKDKTNYIWINDTTNDLTFNWSIQKATLNVPKLKQKTFVYTGEEIDLRNYFEWFDDEVLALDSYGKATDVGTYKTKLSLKDYYNYQWNTKTTGDIDVFWEIKSKTNTLPYIIGVLSGTVVLIGVFVVLSLFLDPKRRNN